MLLHVTDGKVTKVSGDKDHPTNFGRLCTKGSSANVALRDSGRMEKAYSRDQRGLPSASTTMDLAISKTANRLRQIIDRDGPDAVSFYVSGQMSIEAQYLVNKLAKGFVGTNNIESNSRLCMASAGSGYKLSLGADGPPGSYQDFDHADVFFVIGANMADCHPILFLRMMDRVKAGAKLIVVDPRRNTTADKAHLFMQITPGTDLALINGLLHLLWVNGHTDAEFIAEYTEGWAHMPDFLADYTPDKVAAITGIAEASIREAAQLIGNAKEFMSCWTMGLNQSTHGTWNTNAICNLHLATGKICRLGSGPFSLTGQPNAMGGREMGYMGPGLPGQRSVLVDDDRAFMEDLWQVPAGTLHTNLGQGTVDLFHKMAEGSIKACWIICTNPVATVPNRKTVIAALEKAEVIIAQDAFLDTETNRYADILLPAALWAEAEGVMINSERNMTLMQKGMEPPGEALPDWQIIARVACEMGYAEAFSYATSEEVFAEITRCSNPKTGYDLRGASHARLRETPLQWPCSPERSNDRNPIRYLNDGISQPLLAAESSKNSRLIFPTKRAKGVFFARPHLDPAEMPNKEFPFVLNTGRLQHQWHTMTKTGKIPMLNKLNPGPFIEIHPEDAANLGIKDKQPMEIRSRRGRAVLPAVVTDRVLAGNCFAPFHWNDFFGEYLAINAVTNDAVDPISLQPEFKFCAVSLTPVAATEALLHADSIKGGQSTTKAALSSTAHTSAPPPIVLMSLQESDMSRIDAFAGLLGIADTPPPILSDAEQRYMAGFLSGLRNGGALQHAVPTLPTSAPFAAEHKLWLDGVLAGLFSRVESSVPMLALNATPTVPAKSVTLLWASQTGNCEALASRYAEQIKVAGITVKLVEMANYTIAELQQTDSLLCITSTFGDGDSPDNGQGLWDALNSEAHVLSHLSFAVLALGDPNYDQFCGHGKRLDLRLAELGATRLLARIDCDTEYQSKADGWLQSVIDSLKASAEPISIATPNAAAPVAMDSAPTKANPFAARLIKNVRLSAATSSKDTRSFGFDISGSGMVYEAGDALGVWPSNCPELVDELLSLSKLSADTPVQHDKHGEISLRDALTRHYEIAKPHAEALALIANRSTDPRLATLLQDSHKAELKSWLWGRQLADVLHDFPVDLSSNDLLSILKPLQPRLYSISSSPKAHPDEVHLTVAAVRYAQGSRARKGVSSTFLADRASEQTIPLFVQKSASFRPPQAAAPLIMVGPGTGVAPFRGFLHERRARGDTGKNWLFFGEQYAATDFYYRDELEGFHKDGLLTRLDLAFSRDQAEKIYVQDQMQAQGAQLWQWLEEGASFCVCGDASKMAKDVDLALKQIIAKHGGISSDKASDYVAQMSREKRYLRDVY
jgi:sulfite reductase (NADPH) flavoprotein alpha-component